MSNTFGTRYRFTVWGQSHAPAVGVTIEGLPAGFAPDLEALCAFLARRAPGNSPLVSGRKEPDMPEFIAGLRDGVTCGAPLTAVIFNRDANPSDYTDLRCIPRPGHADYTSYIKYGSARDTSGGGQFSGRMTAPLCIAGGLALQLLAQEGIRIDARALSVGDETDPDAMTARILAAKSASDSVGGVIECVCEGVPAGLGEPMFGGMENRISQAVFGIPAVKGIEFGAGFEAARMTGSEHNDAFYYDDSGTVRTRTNRHGGILGGITTGMPIVFRAAVKPTPSIGMPQESVNLEEKTGVTLSLQGRHDPCIVPRAIPCVEAAAAAALYDALLESR